VGGIGVAEIEREVDDLPSGVNESLRRS